MDKRQKILIVDDSEKYFSSTEMIKRKELLQLMHDWKKEIWNMFFILGILIFLNSLILKKL